MVRESRPFFSQFVCWNLVFLIENIIHATCQKNSFTAFQITHRGDVTSPVKHLPPWKTSYTCHVPLFPSKASPVNRITYPINRDRMAAAPTTTSERRRRATLLSLITLIYTISTDSTLCRWRCGAWQTTICPDGCRRRFFPLCVYSGVVVVVCCGRVLAGGMSLRIEVPRA